MVKLGYLYGGKVKGSVNLGIDPYTGLPSTFTAPGGFIGPTAGFGKFYYVDAVNGNDVNDGLSPATALKTITAAVGKCTAGADDVIIAKGSFAEQVVINKRAVHLYGVMSGFGDQRRDETKLQSTPALTGATILIQAYDVEVAYLYVAGNCDNHHPAIFADGINGGTRAFIHDCKIWGSPVTWSNLLYANGIELCGDMHTVKNCNIDRSMVGILVTETPPGTCTTYDTLIEANEFRGCARGVEIEAYSPGVKQHDAMIKDNDLNGANVGTAVTADRGIYHHGPGVGHSFIKRNHFANYVDSIDAAGSVLIRNYEAADAGAAPLTV
jgi:hypothetical protein